MAFAAILRYGVNKSDLTSIDKWTINIEKNSRNMRSGQALTITTTESKDRNKENLYVDIRQYDNNISTSRGVYLTEKEYNWLCAKLKEGVLETQVFPEIIENTLNTKGFQIIPRCFDKVMLSQIYRGQPMNIILSKSTINKIIKNYSSMDDVIGVIESRLLKKK